MLDLFRFLAATFTTLITVHWAYNLAWLIAATPLVLVTLPFKKIRGFEFLVFCAHVLQYYVMLGLLAIIRRNWAPEYPELSFWTATLSALIATTWMFGNYFRKAEQERVAYAAYSEVADRPWSDKEALNKGDDWTALRQMVPWYLAASIGGACLAALSLFTLDPFVNNLTETVSSWYDYVLKVPLLPMILAIAGFFMALQFVFKAILYVGAGAAAGGGALLSRRKTDEDEEASDDLAEEAESSVVAE